MMAEKQAFQAEVSRLLEIVAHSLYSDKDMFLRELISNASDACDRLRYAALTQPELIAGDAELRVAIIPDKAKRTLTIADNGIGMSRQEMIDNLGTIARSGTAAFLEAAVGRRQEGRGADRPVRRRLLFGLHGVGPGRGGLDEGGRRRRPGAGSPTARASSPSSEAESGARGTTITLHLHEADDDYAEPASARADRQDIFRPHRAADRARGDGQEEDA